MSFSARLGRFLASQKPPRGSLLLFLVSKEPPAGTHTQGWSCTDSHRSTPTQNIKSICISWCKGIHGTSPQVIPLIHSLSPSFCHSAATPTPDQHLCASSRISSVASLPASLALPFPTPSRPLQSPSLLGPPSPDYNPQAPPAPGAAHAPCSPPPPGSPLPPFLLTSLRPPPPRFSSRIPPSEPVPQPHRHRSPGRAEPGPGPCPCPALGSLPPAPPPPAGPPPAARCPPAPPDSGLQHRGRRQRAAAEAEPEEEEEEEPSQDEGSDSGAAECELGGGGNGGRDPNIWGARGGGVGEVLGSGGGGK